jgi:hypothetical protein
MPRPDTSPADDRFQALLDRGLSREKAERIINAEAREGGPVAGEPEVYEDWTDDELYRRAGELGIEDRYGMGRDELIAAIRAH